MIVLTRTLEVAFGMTLRPSAVIGGRCWPVQVSGRNYLSGWFRLFILFCKSFSVFLSSQHHSEHPVVNTVHPSTIL